MWFDAAGTVITGTFQSSVSRAYLDINNHAGARLHAHFINDYTATAPAIVQPYAVVQSPFAR